MKFKRKADLFAKGGIGHFQQLHDPFFNALLPDYGKRFGAAHLPKAKEEQGQTEIMIAVKMGYPDIIQPGGIFNNPEILMRHREPTIQ
jgi:hypothetical protein